MQTIGRHRTKLATLLSLAVVAVTFGVVLPRIANYGDVWAAVQGLEGEWILILLGLTIVNVITYAPPWMVALPGLRLPQALAFTQASTALTYVVPGGGLVGMAGSYALLRNWSFRSQDVARAVTLTGIWNQLSNLLFPVVGVALVAVESEADTEFTTIAFVGGAVFGVAVVLIALVLWRADMAEAIGDLLARLVDRALRVVRRGPVGWSGVAFSTFQRNTVELLQRRWWTLTLAALVGNLAVFAVLLGCVRAVGIGSSSLTVIEVFAAWSVGRVLGLIPLSPGGLGVVELGLTTMLVGFGGPNAEVVAAVLLYRFLTIVPTLVLGGATMLVWRRLHPGEGAGVPASALNAPANEGAEPQASDGGRTAG